jgi:hypothetical protein
MTISSDLSNQCGNLCCRKDYRKSILTRVRIDKLYFSSLGFIVMYSIIVRRIKDNQAVGVALSFDAYDEPTEVDVSKDIGYVLDMLGMSTTLHV